MTKTRRRLGALAVAGVMSAGLVAVAAQPAAAATASYSVNYDFATGFLAGYASPTTPPAGADNWSCRPGSAHPYPVVLVHGTLANMNDNWGGLSPLLADNGYCVFALNYGGASSTGDVQGTGEIGASAGQLASFVSQVLSATGASKVDIVGHSQGGMMPRYYIRNLGGAARVDKLVALSPSNNGTTLDGLTQLGSLLGLTSYVNGVLSSVCEACAEQETGSAFLSGLNSGGETAAGIGYTVITTRDDEVISPYTSADLPAAGNVTDITVQNQCGLDGADHLEIAYDPIALTDVLNALDPAHPRSIPCQIVLPVTGPLL